MLRHLAHWRFVIWAAKEKPAPIDPPSDAEIESFERQRAKPLNFKPLFVVSL